MKTYQVFDTDCEPFDDIVADRLTVLPNGTLVFLVGYEPTAKTVAAIGPGRWDSVREKPDEG